MVRARAIGIALTALAMVGVWGSTAARATGTPSLTVADVTAVEGDAGVATIPVPVDLSAPSAVPVKVPYSVVVSSDGTADAADAQLKRGALAFPAGSTSKTIGVASIGDTIIEPDQHVLVVLGTPVGGTATIADGTGVVTLTDDDANGVNPGIEVSVGDIVITEADAGVHRGYIPVVLSRPALVLTKVGFTVDCLTASVLEDISIAKSGTLAFAIGQRYKSIPFSISADLQPEEIEKVTQQVYSRVAGVTVLDNRGDALVMNDDDGALPAFSGTAEPGFVTEGLSGGSTFNQQSIGQIDQLTVTPAGDPAAEFVPYANSDHYTATPDAIATSYDGRFVAFSSQQGDLVSGDTNNISDMFVRDRETGITERVSQHPDGSQITAADGAFDQIRSGAISADGRFVVYQTGMSIMPGDTATSGEINDVYLFDRQTHATELVSQTTAGAFLHGAARPSISAHGRYVSFGVGKEMYVRDRAASTTTAVFHEATPTTPAVMSANGRFIALGIASDACYKQELAVVDLEDGSTERVDVTDDGSGGSPDNIFATYMYAPSISDDGRFVVFKSASWNLEPGATGPNTRDFLSLLHTYVRDRNLLTTTLVGLGAGGVVPPRTQINSSSAISGDGTMIAVSSGGEEPGQIFDRTAGSVGMIGRPWSLSNLDTKFGPTAMSGDGRYVASSSNHSIIYGQVWQGNAFVQRVR